jgi:predicted protein tyrosine phosphatase
LGYFGGVSQEKESKKTKLFKGESFIADTIPKNYEYSGKYLVPLLKQKL